MENAKPWLTWPLAIIGMIMIVIVSIVVLKTQIEHYDRFNEYCDNKFGVNNWTIVPVADEDRLQFYIGQQDTCVSNYTEE